MSEQLIEFKVLKDLFENELSTNDFERFNQKECSVLKRMKLDDYIYYRKPIFREDGTFIPKDLRITTIGIKRYEKLLLES